MSNKLERELIVALIDLAGAHRELYGVYAAVGNEPARDQAAMESDQYAEKIDEWFERNQGAETKALRPINITNYYQDPGSAESTSDTLKRMLSSDDPIKGDDEPGWDALINNYPVSTQEPEESSDRRGTLVTDLSQLRKGDVVDCYWDSKDKPAYELKDVVLPRNPAELDNMGVAGFGAGNYWWYEPGAIKAQQVRLVEKAKPGRLTDSSLLPDSEGSRVMAYRIEGFSLPLGVELIHDGDTHAQWGVSYTDKERLDSLQEHFYEDFFCSEHVEEFEVIHDAGKENA